MLGGSWFQRCFGDPTTAPQGEMVQRAEQAVREQLGLEGKPERTMVRVQQSCIPQYTLGHWKRMEHIQHLVQEQQLPLSLIGASYSGVSVNDCIASARTAVGRLMGNEPHRGA
ncbi:protoporphyrinogen oxidase [Excalfactoria chinensis]|uniref:protoporphyrinogen oxidase n=1 Tax=Excalfactoria chinensis TaxID=46218 RepID=UPI003B3ACB23